MIDTRKDLRPREKMQTKGVRCLSNYELLMAIIGVLIDDAMDAVERDPPSLKGVLPKNYSLEALDFFGRQKTPDNSLVLPAHS